MGTGSVTRKRGGTSLSPKRMRVPSGRGVTMLPGSRFPSGHARRRGTGRGGGRSGQYGAGTERGAEEDDGRGYKRSSRRTISAWEAQRGRRRRTRRDQHGSAAVTNEGAVCRVHVDDAQPSLFVVPDDGVQARRHGALSGRRRAQAERRSQRPRRAAARRSARRGHAPDRAQEDGQTSSPAVHIRGASAPTGGRAWTCMSHCSARRPSLYAAFPGTSSRKRCSPGASPSTSIAST